MGHLYGANLLHAFLARLLFLEQLALTAHITTITLGCHILAHLTYRLTGNDLGTYGRLDGDVKLLARNQVLKFLAHAPA